MCFWNYAFVLIILFNINFDLKVIYYQLDYNISILNKPKDLQIN